MNTAERTYHDQIDAERLDWKEKYYRASSNNRFNKAESQYWKEKYYRALDSTQATIDKMLAIDKDMKERYPLEMLEG